MFKKKISQEEFVKLLLKIRSEIEASAIKAFNENFEYNGDKEKLKYEAMIFSLWIVTLSTPPDKPEIKDMLHGSFSEMYWGAKENKPLFEQIDKRYRNYYEAFNMWQRNPESGHMIGTVMIEIIKNQNPDFSLSKEIPSSDATEVLKAFALFGELFKFSLKMVGEIMKKYKIENF